MAAAKPNHVQAQDLGGIPASLILAALVVLAFLLRLRVGYYQLPSFDGCGYIMHAWSLAQGRLTTVYWAKGVDHYYQPLYPLFILLFHQLLKDWVPAANIANHVLGALLVIPVYLWGRKVYGRAGGILSAALMVSYPLLVDLSSSPSSEPAFILAFVFGIYFLHRLGDEKKSRLAIFCGACFGLSYLARMQAGVFIPLTGLTFLWLVLRKKISLGPAVKYFALLLVSFYVFALPYDLYCVRKDGIYGLRARQEFVKKVAEARTSAWFIEERSLDRDAENLQHFRLARSTSPVSYVLSRPWAYLKIALVEFEHSAREVVKEGILINPLIALALLFALAAVLSGQYPAPAIRKLEPYWLWIFFFSIIPPLTATALVRYFVWLAPVLALYGAGGILFLRGFGPKIKHLKWLASKPALLLWVAGLLVLFPHDRLGYLSSKKLMSEKEKQRVNIANWLKKTLPEKDKIIISEDAFAPMTTGNHWYLMPLDWPMRVIKYAQVQGADYILMEEHLFRLYDVPGEWSDYFISPSDKPGFKYIASYPEGAKSPLAVLYKVQPAKPENQNPPNIILITVGSLRPDHISAFGGQAKTTPNLDRMAEKGVAFNNAVTSSSETDWSLLSILNSMYLEVPVYLSQHNPSSGAKWSGLDIVNLAELLKARGFQTAAFTGFKASAAGFQALPLKGFDFNDSDLAKLEPAGLSSIVSWLDRHDPNRPFFMFLHADLDPALKNELARAEASRKQPAPEETSRLISLYDAQLKSTDEILGDFFAELEKRKLSGENTFIIVTSDHGTGFGAHGSFGSNRLYSEVARVPLFLSWPGHLPAGKIISSQVRSIDLAPTLLDYCGLAIPPQTQGLSLRPVIDSANPADIAALSEHLPEAAFSSGPETLPFDQAFRVSGLLFYRMGKDDSLYYPGRDPDEQKNLLDPKNLPDFMPGAPEADKVERLRDLYGTLSKEAHNHLYFSLKHLEKFSKSPERQL